MKNKLLKVLALGMVFSLAACGSNGNSGSTSSVSSQTSTTQEAMTKSELSTLFLSVTDKTLNKLGIDLNENQVEKSLNPTTSPLTDKTSSSYKGAVGNMANASCYAEFIGNLYKRDEFVVSDNIVKFTVYYQALEGNVTLHMLPRVDKANNKIEIEVIQNMPSQDLYYYMSIDYNFTTSTVNAYQLCTYNSGTYANLSISSSGDVYSEAYLDTDTNDFVTTISQMRQSFITKEASEISLSADFNTEFNNFTTKGSKAFYAAFSSNN